MSDANEISTDLLRNRIYKQNPSFVSFRKSRIFSTRLSIDRTNSNHFLLNYAVNYACQNFFGREIGKSFDHLTFGVLISTVTVPIEGYNRSKDRM